MVEEKQLKMAIIAGASHALKYKDQHWKATPEEILQHISKHMEEILKQMDNPL